MSVQSKTALQLYLLCCAIPTMFLKQGHQIPSRNILSETPIWLNEGAGVKKPSYGAKTTSVVLMFMS